MKIFTHTNLRTDYSFLDAVETPSRLVAKVKVSEVPVLVADQETLAGGLEISKFAVGAKNKIGVGISLTIRSEGVTMPARLFCRGEIGWRNLCQLGVRKGGDPVNITKLEKLADISMVLCGDPVTQLSARGRERSLEKIGEVFSGRLFVEDLRAPAIIGQGGYIQEAEIVSIATKYGASPVAAVPVKYWAPEDRMVWKSLRAISASRSGKSNAGEIGCHALDQDEMMHLFGENARQALRNAENFVLDHLWVPPAKQPLLPAYKGASNPNQALRDRSESRLQDLLAAGILISSVHSSDVYRTRLRFELDIIITLGFASYFLIVSDFCGWARAHGISVGPGRGSGAGSLVARCIGITSVDPVSNGLYFERFLNPDRVSLPDFDVDFAEDHCHKVFQHIRDEYGNDHVSRVATYSYLRGKSAIKEIAAARAVPFAIANYVTGAYPENVSIPNALSDAGFQRALSKYPVMKEVCESAAKVEGLKRQIGLHPAGLVISLTPVSDFAPVFLDEHKLQITSYDMKSVEACGLVKFDILSLSTLSIIDEARMLITASGAKPPPEIDDIQADDPEVYDMLSAGRSVSVFQFDEMQSALKTVVPRQFSDLVVLNALYRPGPIENISVFADRKRRSEAGEPVDLQLPPPSDLTKLSLSETYGIMVYQEQVMEIAKICAGFTLGQADLLRRAIGKKIPDEIEAVRINFVDGCQRTTGMAVGEAKELFASIEKFASYGFNKSHAVAYAHLGYVTALYKRRFTAAWFAAALNREPNAFTRHLLADECRSMGVAVLAPDINSSVYRNSVLQSDAVPAIRLGLSYPKGLTEKSPLIAQIIEARRLDGPFSDFQNFMGRVGASGGATQIESLIWAGAFDEFTPNRTAAREMMTIILGTTGGRRVSTAKSRDLINQSTLFSPAEVNKRNSFSISGANLEAPLARALCLPEARDRVALEQDRLGFLTDTSSSDYLVDRALKGSISFDLFGQPVKSTIISVRDLAHFNSAALFNTGPSGRCVIVGNVVSFWNESSRRPGAALSMNFILSSHCRRHTFRLSDNTERLDAVQTELLDLYQSATPVLLRADWALTGETGGVDIRVVDLLPIASIHFTAEVDDLRVRLRIRPKEQIPSYLYVGDEMNSIQETVSALSLKADRPTGILLVTDGISRRIDVSRTQASLAVCDIIASLQSVEEIYVGRRRVFGPGSHHSELTGALPPRSPTMD